MDDRLKVIRGIPFIIKEVNGHSIYDYGKVYKVFHNMRQRCYNKNHKFYNRYGARDIKVCDRWLETRGFINFMKDMGERPSDRHQLDRIDNNGGYSPENCKWSTRIEQCNNRSDNVTLTHDNKTLTLMQWCREVELKPTTLTQRLYKYGWSVDKALTTKVGKRG